MKALFFLSIVLTAVAMSAGLAHLFALPNKISLAANDYLIVQQIYRGWALLGIVIVAALLCVLGLAVSLRHASSAFQLTVAAAVCIAASLVVFFSFTFPANRATANWTELPDGWQSLRRQWEYSHAVGALLYFSALACLTLAALNAPRHP
jgi:hypothetical protein